MKYVVDSNVAIVANGKSHVDEVGQYKAARFLWEVMQSGVVMVDEEGLAIDEYRKHLSFSGAPGIGDEFFAWVVRERWVGVRATQVPTAASGSSLDVLPPSLAGFDSDDHKWICIYLSGGADFIVNAVDSDWANDIEILASEGIRVLEILD